jgi:hypothetical protein
MNLASPLRKPIYQLKGFFVPLLPKPHIHKKTPQPEEDRRRGNTYVNI